MTIVEPTITTNDTSIYEIRMDDFLKYASRIHIDITDGKFAPSQTINLNQLYWLKPEERSAKIDLHLMMANPLDWLDQIVSLGPDKVILHAESNDAASKLPKIFTHLRKFGIQSGVALLPSTQPSDVAEIIKTVDSVLIFGGHLGYQGGEADLTQLKKVALVKAIKKQATIEWDGGANVDNIKQIATAGVDIINVGSAISKAPVAEDAYRDIIAALN